MRSALSLGASLLLLLGCACACSRRSSRPGAEAVVAGTVVDAASGAPVPDVPLEGPQGARAVSGRARKNFKASSLSPRRISSSGSRAALK